MGHQTHLLIMRISESEPRIRAPSASEWDRLSAAYSSNNPILTRRSSKYNPCRVSWPRPHRLEVRGSSQWFAPVGNRCHSPACGVMDPRRARGRHPLGSICSWTNYFVSFLITTSYVFVRLDIGKAADNILIAARFLSPHVANAWRRNRSSKVCDPGWGGATIVTTGRSETSWPTRMRSMSW